MDPNAHSYKYHRICIYSVFFYYLYTVHMNKNTHVHMHTAENCVQIYILCELISKKRTGISKTGNVDHLLKITVENAGPLWA